ncbi:hypothetical protein JCM8097_000836 [Rhodosporidiobolus ruineniae]
MSAPYISLAGEPGAHNIGKDAPRPAETKGISLHHACLRIKDPKKALPFFKDVLGMRTLFTYNAGSFSIFYMFHSEDDVDAEKVWADFPNQKGLLELIHRHGSEDEASLEYKSGNEPAHAGFGHLGLIVDDVPQLVKRAQEFGCKVIKPQGVSSAETVGWPEGTPQPIEAYNQLYSNMAMIECPDNHLWVELVPRHME